MFMCHTERLATVVNYIAAFVHNMLLDRLPSFRRNSNTYRSGSAHACQHRVVPTLDRYPKISTHCRTKLGPGLDVVNQTPQLNGIGRRGKERCEQEATARSKKSQPSEVS
jgi:hypothetical protein